MAVWALVGRAVLSVVTFIVAKKTLGARHGGRFEKHPGQGLSGGSDDSSSFSGDEGGCTAEEGVFLRESGLGYKGLRRGRRSGRDARR